MELTETPALNLERQSFLGSESDVLLERCHVGIIGLGGGGSHIAQQLAHVGVGVFSAFDHDKVEDTNLNRMVGATAEDVARQTYKVHVAQRLIMGVNPRARVCPIAKRWQTSAEQLRLCDVIFGCVDSLVERQQIETLARRYLIPYIDIGMDVHRMDQRFAIAGQVALSLPGEPCLRCFGIIREELLVEEAGRYGAAGGRPQVIWPNGGLASTAVGLFINLIAPWHDGQVPLLLEYDGNAHTILPSQKLRYVTRGSCPHFAGLADLGDPFWTPMPAERTVK